MIPVDQTMTVQEHGKGNCLEAVVASLLEIPLSEVPSFREGDWFDNLQAIMRKHGRVYGGCFTPDKNGDFTKRSLKDEEDSTFDGYVLANGYTDRIWPEGTPKAGEPIYHSVVLDWKTKTVAHDPHPTKFGLSKISDCLIWDKIPITESRVLEIGREELAKKRETFHPGGGAKPGPMFGGVKL